uniref:Protein kinase domain-containing protein n=1 Tax=Vannella robusta TaxID=1487602 RepID=A0A7S4HW30_9EUKA|mmetsp:Transcript_16446/g.21035  ORF Transcript_16446/g.21035 Transcript_16446/m.21035 type:complete len:305 (+) Transcript_16446:206-1120(+)|eukprot:CAMPEP_0206204026 /NCGR_PEP_ID=MMETSP0166-20121206/13251_1 /ASSEMBLY_ACC=CAM_ASM_000260 /TAXON_ID=95228 /ORGANISM="Vannella robusta, Strain DIVA3 518/3/11/1/6" /LENGTH=304 /DNA_ID=CAMNT_0053623519 /DNA_START=199 /DNA_END=1113 /DNA_ORIENTATION=+
MNRRSVRFSNIQTSVSNTTPRDDQDQVTHGFDGRSHQMVSIHVVKFKTVKVRAQFQNEMVVAGLLKHINPSYICKTLEISCGEEWGSIVTGKHKSTLFDFVFETKGDRRVIEPEAKRIFTKICLGVKTLHELGIAHLDIKPENVYFDENTGVPHIFNFASAAHVTGSKGSKSFVVDRLGVRGTHECHPPELLNKCKCYDPFKVDVYCLGVLLHIMIAKYYPYSCKNEEVRAPIFDVASEHVADSGVALLKQMLDENPFNRPTIYEILRHPWVRLGARGSSPKFLRKMKKVRTSCLKKSASLKIW